MTNMHTKDTNQSVWGALRQPSSHWVTRLVLNHKRVPAPEKQVSHRSGPMAAQDLLFCLKMTQGLCLTIFSHTK